MRWEKATERVTIGRDADKYYSMVWLLETFTGDTYRFTVVSNSRVP